MYKTKTEVGDFSAQVKSLGEVDVSQASLKKCSSEKLEMIEKDSIYKRSQRIEEKESVAIFHFELHKQN